MNAPTTVKETGCCGVRFVPSRRRNHLHGFTFVEVIVASLVFSITVLGALALITQMSQPVEFQEDRVTAAFLAKRVAEEVRRRVDAVTWNDSINGAVHPRGGPFGNGTYPVGQVTIGPTTFKPSYTVSADPTSNARKITVSIEW